MPLVIKKVAAMWSVYTVKGCQRRWKRHGPSMGSTIARVSSSVTTVLRGAPVVISLGGYADDDDDDDEPFSLIGLPSILWEDNERLVKVLVRGEFVRVVKFNYE